MAVIKAGGETFGVMPPETTAISNALLAEIRDKIAALSQLSVLVTVLQSSLSLSQLGNVSLSTISSNSSAALAKMDEIKTKLDNILSQIAAEIAVLNTLATEATLLTRATEATLLTRATEATLLTRATEATLATRASESTLVAIDSHIEEVKQDTGGVKAVRVLQNDTGILGNILEALGRIELQLSIVTGEETI